jgi:hypothetical protein
MCARQGFGAGCRRRRGPSLESLEARTLLALAPNNIEDLTAVAVSAIPNVSLTQDVATFSDTDSTAVAADFTASVNWGDGSSITAGTVTEDASDLFHAYFRCSLRSRT